MRLIFFGTPAFAIPSLKGLHKSDQIELVVTRPARPLGRKQIVSPSPVFDEAMRLGLPCITPNDVNSSTVIARVRSIEPEVLVVVAYGRLIGACLLKAAPYGALNIHPSLLPLHRGAAPIQAAILSGHSETGVTVMRMDEGLDTGPMLIQWSTAIGVDETASELAVRLADAAPGLLAETLERLEGGLLELQPQDDSLATISTLMKREDGNVDWRRTAEEIYRLWRALHPWPGIHTRVVGRTVKVLNCSTYQDIDITELPGRAHLISGKLIVGTGNGWLEMERVQPEGGRPMSGDAFVRGCQEVLDADWGT